MEYTPIGKGNAALTTGIIGTAGFGLSLLGSLLGGGGWPTPANAVTANSGNAPVNRYEVTLLQELAAKDAQIALRDANTYGDQKMLEMYKYFDGELKDIRNALCDQAVHNQRTEDSFVLARQDIAAAEERCNSKIKLEAERRCCADNAIVNYTNATFYPKAVADVTVGTTTTSQILYNPIPKCGDNCDCN